MAGVDDLRELMEAPGALAYAFDPFGAAGLPMPPEFAIPPDRILPAAAPLDLLRPESQGAAIVAFEHARREGRGGTAVDLADEPGASWLEIVDLTDEYGCFVAVIAPHDPTGPLERTPTVLAPRRAAYRLSVTGVIESINPAFSAMFGWEADEVVGESSLNLIHPDDHEAGIVAWVELLEAPGTMTRLRQRFRRADGEWLWCESTDYNHLDDADDPHLLGELIDISREVAAEDALQRRETMLDRLYRALPTGVVVIEPDGSVATTNDRWIELVGESDRGPLETLLDRVVERDAVVELLGRAADFGEDGDLPVSLRTVGRDDVCRFGALHVRPLVEGDRRVGLLITLDDTTERREYEAALSEQTRRDPLTGALNRLGAEQLIDATLAGDGPLSVCFLDIDDFKSVNDTHGHAAGDEVLCSVVESLSPLLGPLDAIARIGGDEFLVVIRSATDVEELLAELGVELSESLARRGVRGASIGRADRRPGDDFDSLIHRADQAMYADKSRRRRVAGRDRRMATQASSSG